jgi:hypothetical protein
VQAAEAAAAETYTAETTPCPLVQPAMNTATFALG